MLQICSILVSQKCLPVYNTGSIHSSLVDVYCTCIDINNYDVYSKLAQLMIKHVPQFCT